jgi:uncharacterized protein (DUF427 family)
MTTTGDRQGHTVMASYYSIEVDGMRNDAAAWYYRDPIPAAAAERLAGALVPAA